MSEELQYAKETVEQILEMTKALVLTGEKDAEEQELDDYINLLDEREPLVELLEEIKLVMNKSMLKSPEFSEIKKTLDEIRRIDEMHLNIFKQKHAEAREAYKDIKQGQRIHVGYNQLPGNEAASRIDIKH